MYVLNLFIEKIYCMPIEAQETTMRLDKYLANIEFWSRKKVGKMIRKGGFAINNTPVRDHAFTVKEWDILTYQDINHEIRWNVHIRLWKPAGYVSSDKQEWPHPSYEVLLDDFPYTGLVHIAGRLDVDTEGLLILTSNGQLNHRIISPQREKEKEYLVTTRDPVSPRDCHRLTKGIRIEDGRHTYMTRPATVEILWASQLKIILTEGKYHQIKLMLKAIGNEVTTLKRTRVWPWTLEWLEPGWWEYIDEKTLDEFEKGK